MRCTSGITEFRKADSIAYMKPRDDLLYEMDGIATQKMNAKNPTVLALLQNHTTSESKKQDLLACEWLAFNCLIHLDTITLSRIYLLYV